MSQRPAKAIILNCFFTRYWQYCRSHRQSRTLIMPEDKSTRYSEDNVNTLHMQDGLQVKP